MKSLRLLIVASVIVCAALALAQAPADGVFVAAPGEGLVWKSAVAADQWQRAAGQAARDSLIACRVDPGTPFVVQYALPPHGYGIEVIDGANKGCRGVAMSGTVKLHKPMTHGTTAAPRDKPAVGIGRSEPATRLQPGTTVRPLVPPLPPGGAVPVPPILR